jgi:hypothetical protein
MRLTGTVRPRRAGRAPSSGARPLALSVAVLALAGLAGCGGDDGGGGGAEGAKSQQVADGATLAAVSPLTGQKLEGDAASRPVLAVKMDNSSSSAPQIGLGSADLVTEELVEGGITRLAVFYQSRLPGEVGPVRSMRATDIGIVQPLGASLVASGAAPQTNARLKDAGITTYVEGAPGFYRVGDRTAPYNLFVDLQKLAHTLLPAEPAPPYLPFGSDGLPQGVPARSLTATFSGSSSTSFTYSGGHYDNTDANAAAADRFAPETVLVLRVKVGDAGYRDPAGNPVPETKLVGSGPAMVFSGGRLVRAQWVKPQLDSALGLEVDGKPVQLSPGRVWVELVPERGGGVSVGR